MPKNVTSSQETLAVLRQYNPWWERSAVPDLPGWRRPAFGELWRWVSEPPARRAVLLSGARQVGKTTLLLQVVEALLESGVESEQILYATLDHPMLRLLGLEGLLRAWNEMLPRRPGTEYLFIDEVQYARDWQTWLKHQVDFEKHRRIVVTGSAVPLNTENLESGVGRWHTVRLPTLSFYEYLRIQAIEPPRLPALGSLAELFGWSDADRARAGEAGRPLVPHFHEYLLRGGFPQTALLQSVPLAQKLLREDIVDKMLKRDMTSLFGVRRVLELEKTFLYLCLHDGGILDVSTLCSNLGVSKPTVTGFLDVLESAHLIYRLPPFGYGKSVLRGRPKIYLADAAIPGSILLKGKALIEDAAKVGAAVETAFFKHVFARYYASSVGFSYWHGKQGHEVDIVAEVADGIIPFEVKYTHGCVELPDLKGMQLLCAERRVPRAYAITRETADFSVMPLPSGSSEGTLLLKIPAPLACYWLSRAEYE